MRRAVDFGNYSAIPTPDQVRCWIDQGYTKAIIGTSFGNVWQHQLAASEAGGMDVEEYQFAGRMHVTPRRVWVDCELAEDNAAIADVIRGANPYGIYTRRQWWIDNTGDWDIVAEFPWLKLWEAHYQDPPPQFLAFGGWSKRTMVQWHDSTDLCGVNVDLNIIEEESMPTAEYDELKITDDAIKKTLLDHALANNSDLGSIKAALAAVAVANADSFKHIEDRLTKLEAK